MGAETLASLGVGDIAVAVIAGLFGVLMTRLRRPDTPPAEESSLLADHAQQIVDQVQEWADKRIAERDAWMSRQLDERDRSITALGRRVTTLERRYRAALDFIRRVIQRHPETSEDVPTEIRDDLHL